MKRKPEPSQDQTIKSSKLVTRREKGEEAIEQGLPWRNLELSLTIESKEIDVQRKVELVQSYVSSLDFEVNYDVDPRFIVRASNWIQTLLISSDDRVRDKEKLFQAEDSQLCLDCRCWEIFRYCLAESTKLRIPLNLSGNLLRAISYVSRSAVKSLNDVSLNLQDYSGSEEFKLYNTVYDCIKSMLNFHHGSLKGNLDLWMAAVGSSLELVTAILADNLGSSQAGGFFIDLACSVLEPFCKFLRVQRWRKNGFRDFVDILVEPLLHLLGLLSGQSNSSNEKIQQLVKLIEDIISHGLFHPAHMDDFLNLQGLDKYGPSPEGELKESRTEIRSYHRHLFVKVASIISQKKVLALGVTGELFRLFLKQVKRQKTSNLKLEDSRHMEAKYSQKMSLGSGGNVLATKSSDNLNACLRKSVLDFLVHSMEPLLCEMKLHIQSDLGVETSPLTIHSILKSVNKILSCIISEKVYVRTEDISQGACFNFFRMIFDLLVSYSAKIVGFLLSLCDSPGMQHTDLLALIAEELVVAVGYFLEIEYKVMGDDIVDIWVMILAFMAVGQFSSKESEVYPLISRTIELGCQLVNLSRELRQTSDTVFALSKGLRCLSFSQSKDKTKYSGILCVSLLHARAIAKSAGLLLCSQKFRITIHEALKTIPEGQASNSFKLLTEDVSESLNWDKAAAETETGKGKCNRLCLHAELLGKVVSEIYGLVLDSIPLTAGNSSSIAVAIKHLIMVLQQPMMSILVAPTQDSPLSSVMNIMGLTLESNTHKYKSILLNACHWVFTFFFRLYVSCRSLCRQVLSLVPPHSSLRMSFVIGDGFTVYSGTDWMKSLDFINEGYFSWIAQSCSSLPALAQSIGKNLRQTSSADSSPLVYLLHSMVVQRLVDLNNRIKYVEYLLLKKCSLSLGKIMTGDGLELQNKNGGEWEKILSVLKEEAASLTAFMMKSLRFLDQEKLCIVRGSEETSNDSSLLPLKELYYWDLGVCSLDEKTLPTANWWIICQNIDVWCSHATKKMLKTFLSILIVRCLLCDSPPRETEKSCTTYPGAAMKVSVKQIALGLLQDPSFYELRFVRRYLAPSFCSALEKIVFPLSSNAKDINANFSTVADWVNALSTLESSCTATDNEPLIYDLCLKTDAFSFLDDDVARRDEVSFSLLSSQLRDCETLLNLLFHMPKRSLSTKSLSCYIRCLLNVERILVRSFMETHKNLPSLGQCQLLSLLLSCRRALKCLAMAFTTDRNEASECSGISFLCESSHPVLWLLKSVTVVVERVSNCSNNFDLQDTSVVFSLMDHTAYVFLTLGKYYFSRSFHLLMNTEETREQLLDSGNSSDSINACRKVNMIADLLRGQTMGLLLNETAESANREDGFGFTNLNKMSSLLSCIQGFLWGLVATMEGTDVSSSKLSVKPSSRSESFSGIYNLIDSATNFMDSVLQKFQTGDGETIGVTCETQELLYLGGDESLLRAVSSRHERNSPDGGMQHLDPGMESICPGSSDSNNVETEKLALEEAVCTFSASTEADASSEGLRKVLMQGFMTDQNSDMAFFLRELFFASSAILRLCICMKCSPMSPRLMQFFICLSQNILLKFGNMDEMPNKICFIWLDGALQFIEELGCQLASSNPNMTRDVFARLVSLHLRAIGKCISLQQKGAKLASHDRESSTKTLSSRLECLGSSNSDAMYILEELKVRLRASFKMLIKDSLELHLLSTIQVLERAVIGLHEGCTMIYGVTMGKDEGMVTSDVAAAVDCLDLVLESVKGHRRMGVVKRHIQSLTAALFSIVLHLQSHSVFYRNLGRRDTNISPDPGSVVLMCVEVLAIVSRKDTLFQLESSHVAQSLRLPAALFRDFCHVRTCKQSPALNNLMFAAAYENDDLMVDRQFSVDLYAACCRLLYTAIKHRSSECVKCIGNLQYSIEALLNCLEMAGTASMDRNGYFTWTLEEGMKCASYLRRVYEEIREQKAFEEHCFKFLSNYISVFSGLGPLRLGLKREIDETMRPGVHALVDICSDEKLQYLHTVFGEGPCRSTLATLRHDYKLNFQYHGKV